MRNPVIDSDFPDPEIIRVGEIYYMVSTTMYFMPGADILRSWDLAHWELVGHVFDSRLMPKFSILNPKFTMTVPENQMKAGIYDIMNHIMEQYFSDFDDNTSDYLSEGLMRSVIHSSRIAAKNPQDYEARSNIMWTATWALNTLIGLGKQQDWMVHMPHTAMRWHLSRWPTIAAPCRTVCLSLCASPRTCGISKTTE